LKSWRCSPSLPSRVGDRLWDEFRERFPSFSGQKRYSWTWRIPNSHSDPLQVEEMQIIQPEEIPQPQNTTSNSDNEEWPFLDVSDDANFTDHDFME
jgi:hypothetical protein